MADLYDRTRLLIGQEGIVRLKQSHVFLAGVGGVGSFAAEALARAGVGTLTLLDHDCIDITNLNRQLHATQDTVGQLKIEVMAQRIASINPEIQVHCLPEFLLPDNVADILDGQNYQYIIDAVDTVAAKLALICYARERQISVISSMGTANKLDATKFEITDISKTRTCPLARVMRRELKNKGIVSGVKVLYSTAQPVYQPVTGEKGKKPTPGSISYVPAVAGLLLAGYVIQQLLAENEHGETCI